MAVGGLLIKSNYAAVNFLWPTGKNFFFFLKKIEKTAVQTIAKETVAVVVVVVVWLDASPKTSRQVMAHCSLLGHPAAGGFSLFDYFSKNVWLLGR